MSSSLKKDEALKSDCPVQKYVRQFKPLGSLGPSCDFNRDIMQRREPVLIKPEIKLQWFKCLVDQFLLEHFSIQILVTDVHLSNTTKIITSLLAGATAGGLAKTSIAPFDRCKISFQINQEPYTTKAAFNYLKNVIETNGFFALWRGNSATMARILPYASIQFTSHEQWKNVLGINDPKLNNYSLDEIKYRRFLSGSLAGVTSQSLTYPLDLARARMAVTHDSEFATLKQVFKITYRKEGIKGFYKGYIPTVLGVIPYAGASFFTYESLKQWYSEFANGAKPETIILLGFGAVSGFCGQSLSYPLDIVRRRMQTSVITKREYNSILGTLKIIYKEEGIKKGYFKGLSMNWIKGPIAVGISFATYDSLKDFLRCMSSKL